MKNEEEKPDAIEQSTARAVIDLTGLSQSASYESISKDVIQFDTVGRRACRMTGVSESEMGMGVNGFLPEH